jgi:hypothetical protein
MKRILLAVGAMTVLAVAGCGDDDKAPTAAAPASGATAAPASSPSEPAPATAGPAATTTGAVVPAFAALYPGAVVEEPPVTAHGPGGPGGIVAFTTDADPETVVAFYRSQAETAGLSTIASLTQGGARAYSAGDGASGAGKLLSVVATPGVDGPTEVQLTWTAGR